MRGVLLGTLFVTAIVLTLLAISLGLHVGTMQAQDISTAVHGKPSK